MKKLLILLALTLLLTACSSTPEEIEIPDDAVVAVCPQGDTFKYIYKDDVVYEFYSNGELQSDDMKNIVQTAVDSAGTARQYLDNTFQDGVCTFTDYEPE